MILVAMHLWFDRCQKNKGAHTAYLLLVYLGTSLPSPHQIGMNFHCLVTLIDYRDLFQRKKKVKSKMQLCENQGRRGRRWGGNAKRRGGKEGGEREGYTEFAVFQVLQ